MVINLPIAPEGVVTNGTDNNGDNKAKRAGEAETSKYYDGGQEKSGGTHEAAGDVAAGDFLRVDLAGALVREEGPGQCIEHGAGATREGERDEACTD